MSWNIDMPDTLYVSGESSHDEIQQMVNRVRAHDHIAIDTETTGLNKWRDIPLYWSLAAGDWRATLRADALPYFTDDLASDDKTWLLANAKYDMHILANYGFHLGGNIWDVAVMHALLYEDKPHRLKFIAQHILGWTWADFEDSFGKIGKKQSAEAIIFKAEEENFDLLVEYAANDAWGTLKVGEALKAQLEGEFTFSLFSNVAPYINTLWDFFSKVEAPYTRALWKMERRGIKVDRSRFEAARPEAEKKLKELEKAIVKEAGFMLNPRSNPQLHKYFFDTAKLEPLSMTKGGKSGIRRPQCNAAFLEHYKNENEVARLILEHREYTKLYGTYIVGLNEVLDPWDRIHSNFNQDVARCMPAGELVLTSRGYVEVENVEVGNSVITHKGRKRRVTHTSKHKASTIYQVRLENGLVLRTNGGHPYLTQDGWRRADELRMSDSVYTHSEAEEWRHIKGWGGYQVSNWGRVYSTHSGHIMRQTPKNKWGHLKVTLKKFDGSRGKDFGVHQLVAAAFKKKPKSRDIEVRHLNGIGWDNTADNLAYGTSQENANDACRHGTMNGALILTKEQVTEVRKAKRRGQPESTTSKLTFAIAEEIRERHAAGEGRAELARCFDVSYQAVDGIVKNRTWTHERMGVSATELGEKYGVTAAAIRDIWAGRRWNRDLSVELAAHFRLVRVSSTQIQEPEVTYGLTVEEDESHVTGGIVTHNTGRLSSSEPNLQNIPRPENDHWNLRGAFITEPGWSVIAADYGQLEMRLLAAAAMEESMIDIFRRGWDIHSGNGALMYDTSYEDIVTGKKLSKDAADMFREGTLFQAAEELSPGFTSRCGHDPVQYLKDCAQYRNDAKNIGFGLNYGMGSGKLARDLNVSRQIAEAKIAQYKDTYPAVERFMAEAVEEGRKYGYSFTVMGRRRNIPMITSSRRDQRALGERLAVNTQIQGSAADVCRMAQLNIDAARLDEQYDCHMTLQVHDELVFECPTEAVEEVKGDIEDLMAHPFSIELSCPLEAEAGVGPSWGAAK